MTPRALVVPRQLAASIPALRQIGVCLSWHWEPRSTLYG
jgi:hypothetical protein